MFEPEVFRRQIYCIEESICDIVDTFVAPAVIRPWEWFGAWGIAPPVPPSFRPWLRVQQSANMFRNPPLQVKDRTWTNSGVALSVSGVSRSWLCPDGPRVHLSGPAYMPSCIRPEVRLPLDQRVLCSDCCIKYIVFLRQVVFSYFVLHSSKILLVLTTKVTDLRSLLFRLPDGVNYVVRRVYLIIIPKFLSCLKTE